MKTALAAAAALLILGAALVGCEDKHPPAEVWGPAGGTALPLDYRTPTTPPGSPRPRELRLDGKDPCATVPQADWATFAIDRAIPEQDPTFRSPACFFNSSWAAMSVVLVVTEGIEAWAPGARTAQPAPVDPVHGFPAISLVRPENATSCDIAVDVATGQYVLAGAVIDLNDLASVPERCAYAHQFAEVVLRTLLGT